MIFEWDEEKNQANIRKHKISFDLAKRVFYDERHLEVYDFEHSTQTEDRYVALGMVEQVLYVVFTERCEAIRIISARKATAAERRIYYDYDETL